MSTKEEIAKAFDDFDNEKYTNAEEALQGVFKKKVNDHLKDKLNLKNDVIKMDSDSNGDDE